MSNFIVSGNTTPTLSIQNNQVNGVIHLDASDAAGEILLTTNGNRSMTIASDGEILINYMTATTTIAAEAFTGTLYGYATSANVNVEPRLTGNGSSISLDIAQQGATLGDVLMWNSTVWTAKNPQAYSLERIGYPTAFINSDLAKTIITLGNQSGYPVWGSYSNGLGMFALNTIVDSESFPYVTGYFTNTMVVYGPTTTTMTATLPQFTITGDVNTSYITKYDYSGNPIWSNYSYPRNSATSTEVIASSNTDIFLGISYVNTYNIFGPSSNTLTATIPQLTLPPNSLADTDTGCLIKYNSDGFPQRANILGLTSAFATFRSYGIATDTNENSYIFGAHRTTCGIYDATTTLNAGTPLFTLPNTSSVNEQLVIVKYDINGIPLWGSRTSDAIVGSNGGIVVGNTFDIYICGVYTSTIGFYGPTTTLSVATIPQFTLPGDGSDRSLIVKYNSNGDPQWGNYFNGRSFSIALDSNENVYVGGIYSSTFALYGPTSTLAVATIPQFTLGYNSGGDNIFLVKYDSNGNPQWAARLNTYSTYSAINVDNLDNIYITGRYTSTGLEVYGPTSSLTTATLSQFSLPIAGSDSNAFVIKYSTSGDSVWGSYLSGTGGPIVGRNFSVGNNGNIYLTATGASTTILAHQPTLNGGITNTITQITLPYSSGNNGYLINYQGDYLVNLPDSNVDGFSKTVATGNASAYVIPESTVDGTAQNILLNPNENINIFWDADNQNWIVQSITGTLM